MNAAALRAIVLCGGNMRIAHMILGLDGAGGEAARRYIKGGPAQVPRQSCRLPRPQGSIIWDGRPAAGLAAQAAVGERMR